MVNREIVNKKRVIARSAATKQSTTNQYSGLLPASYLAVRNDDTQSFNHSNQINQSSDK
jgi:hypothetical protein